MPYSVLFVCTANLNRSPMAEAFLRQMVAEEADQWRIASAGTWARQGYPPVPEALRTMADYGLDIGNHRSQPLTAELLAAHRLVLVMESGHKEALRAEFPHLAGRVYLLSEMAGKSAEVHDPMGGTPEDFEDAARQIRRYLSEGFPRIRQLAWE